jgi:hypothetical protein
MRLRVERAVRSGIFRWVGLPAGGAGTLAFLLTLLVWIPQQARQANSLVVEPFKEALAESLTDQEMLLAVLGEQLDSITHQWVNQEAGGSIASSIEEWSKQQVKSTLDHQLERTDESVESVLDQALAAEQMAAPISDAVTATLKSNDFKLLRAAITPTLRPIAERLSETIASNTERTVLTVTNPMRPEQFIDKRSPSMLVDIQRTLASRAASHDEFVLSFYLAVEGAPLHEYRPDAIRQYLDLRHTANERVRYTLILASEKRFVAFADISHFENILNENGNALVAALNQQYASLEDGTHRMAGLLGADSLAYLKEGLTIREALTDEGLSPLAGQAFALNQRVAVVGGDDTHLIFRGVTSRCHLIEALLPQQEGANPRCSVKPESP